MNKITRRQFLASSLASALTPLIASGPAQAATPTLLRAESRVIEVRGKAAKVYGLVRGGGQQGLALEAGQAFRVRLDNALDAPTLIHWHGLTPPFAQFGVPDLPQPLIQQGESIDYAFPLDTPGTHWMHAHTLSGPAATIEVGSHPAHVIADPAGERAFVSNSGEDAVSVVGLATGETVEEIGTGDYPHGLRISPDGDTIYVANVEDGTVSVIDVQGLNEMHRLEVGKAPVQVGFTPDGSRVYVSLRDENKVAVIDTATLQVTNRIAVWRSPIQMHATLDGKFVYVANQGSETEPDETVSDDGAHVFVTNIVDGTVTEISVATQSVVRTHDVGEGPDGITFQAQ